MSDHDEQRATPANPDPARRRPRGPGMPARLQTGVRGLIVAVACCGVIVVGRRGALGEPASGDRRGPRARSRKPSDRARRDPRADGDRSERPRPGDSPADRRTGGPGGRGPRRGGRGPGRDRQPPDPERVPRRRAPDRDRGADPGSEGSRAVGPGRRDRGAGAHRRHAGGGRGRSTSRRSSPPSPRRSAIGTRTCACSP